MNEQQQPQQKNNSGCLIWIILAVLFYIFVLAPSKSSSSPKVTPTPAPTPTPRPTIALPTPSLTPRLYNGWELNTGRHLYDSISNELSQINAYYLGMIDMCSDVLTWGLPKNERQS